MRGNDGWVHPRVQGRGQAARDTPPPGSTTPLTCRHDRRPNPIQCRGLDSRWAAGGQPDHVAWDEGPRAAAVSYEGDSTASTTGEAQRCPSTGSRWHVARGRSTGAFRQPRARRVAHRYTTNLAGRRQTARLGVGRARRPAPVDPGTGAAAVPHLYFWKSAKWIAEMTCWTTTSGLWERNATTTGATPGSNSATRVTEWWLALAPRQSPRSRRTPTAKTITLGPHPARPSAGQHVSSGDRAGRLHRARSYRREPSTEEGEID